MDPLNLNHAPADLYKGKNSGTHWLETWVIPRAAFNILESRKTPVHMGIRTPGRPTRIAVAIPTTLFRINTLVLWKLLTQLSPNDVEVHISNNEYINCVSELPSVTVEKHFSLNSINK